MKNIGNYRKYDIFFEFCVTENMIFPPIVENPGNMIFTLSVSLKMLFFMQCLTCQNVGKKPITARMFFSISEEKKTILTWTAL